MQVSRIYSFTRWRRFLAQPLAAALLVLVLYPVVVDAQPAPAQPDAMQEQEAAPGPVDEKQALERVRARFPGNVIAINEVRQGNRVRFRIRLDNEGNIYTVFVDKATGAISRE